MNKKNAIIATIVTLVIISIVICMFVFLKDIKEKNNTNAKEETIVNQIPSSPKLDYVVEDKDGIRKNISSEFSKEKKVENFSITKDLFASKAEKTEIILNVKNNSEQKSELTKVEVTLLDKKGKELKKLNGIINEINPGETSMLYITASLDLTDAYDYKVEIIK